MYVVRLSVENIISHFLSRILSNEINMLCYDISLKLLYPTFSASSMYHERQKTHTQQKQNRFFFIFHETIDKNHSILYTIPSRPKTFAYEHFFLSFFFLYFFLLTSTNLFHLFIHVDNLFIYICK